MGRRLKLSMNDYTEIIRLSETDSIGYIARRFGLSRKQVGRILRREDYIGYRLEIPAGMTQLSGYQPVMVVNS